MNVLSESCLDYLVANLELKPENVDLIKEQQDSFVSEVHQIMNQFPYICVTWNLKDLLKQDEQEFKGFLREVKLNFNASCIEVLEQTN